MTSARHLVAERVIELADGRREFAELYVEEHDAPDFFTIGIGRGMNAVGTRVTSQHLLDGYDDVLQGLSALWLREVIRRVGAERITWREVVPHLT